MHYYAKTTLTEQYLYYPGNLGKYLYFPGSALKSRAAYSVKDGFGSLVSGSWSPYGEQLIFVTTEGKFFSLKKPRLAKPSDKRLS